MSHTGEKRFACQQCNRGFANSQNLKTHTYTHTGERRFPCTKCSKRFTNMTNLRTHLVTHTGEKNFLCNLCGASFSQRNTLDFHLTSHSNNRPHSCGQCTRAFKTTRDLKKHCRTHTGVLPFWCTICERRFLRQDNLQRHYRTVHKPLEKLVSSTTEPQLKTSTASKSSPIIARNVQRECETRSEHKKMLEEKETFELPNRDSNPTFVLVTPEMHDTAEKEMRNKTNDVNNIVEVELSGFERETEQQTSLPDLFSSCPILIDEDELLEATNQMQVDNVTQTHDTTTSSEAAHGTQILTLEVQGQDENQGEFENALNISANENGETSGGITLLYQSTSSPPLAEIQADIQGNRGPRKYYISRYYFVHQTDSSTSS
ncbi:Zinc finger and BTB domain-containing protein 17 [Orchesella cincta]|uniref:Zinc finger and BTB domain-containing protein 17 n=1 Tax=Orchesella cincta TaxID=48709 RepID=A0A1D2MC47_ORCCI|nr:Zinc finger and BTB domain-containing protein 17 [Orchesella cincta]